MSRPSGDVIEAPARPPTRSGSVAKPEPLSSAPNQHLLRPAWVVCSRGLRIRAERGPWSHRRDPRTTTKAGLRRSSRPDPSVALDAYSGQSAFAACIARRPAVRLCSRSVRVPARQATASATTVRRTVSADARKRMQCPACSYPITREAGQTSQLSRLPRGMAFLSRRCTWRAPPRCRCRCSSQRGPFRPGPPGPRQR